MAYAVELRKQTMKSLKSLPSRPRRRIWEAIRSLGDEPRPTGSKKLTNCPEWRIRVRDYRAVYRIDDEGRVVTVVRIAHWKDAY